MTSEELMHAIHYHLQKNYRCVKLYYKMYRDLGKQNFEKDTIILNRMSKLNAMILNNTEFFKSQLNLKSI